MRLVVRCVTCCENLESHGNWTFWNWSKWPSIPDTKSFKKPLLSLTSLIPIHLYSPHLMIVTFSSQPPSYLHSPPSPPKIRSISYLTPPLSPTIKIQMRTHNPPHPSSDPWQSAFIPLSSFLYFSLDTTLQSHPTPRKCPQLSFFAIAITLFLSPWLTKSRNPRARTHTTPIPNYALHAKRAAIWQNYTFLSHNPCSSNPCTMPTLFILQNPISVHQSSR
jgi:hypothetical protein